MTPHRPSEPKKSAAAGYESHDIYGTRKRSPSSLAAEPDSSHATFWSENMKRGRKQSYLFTAAVFLFVTLTAVILFQQNLLSNRPSFEVVTTPEPTKTSLNFTQYLDLELKPDALMLLEEMRDEPPAELDGEDMPLNNYWVKQAAYHLIQAERAKREELPEIELEHYETALRIFPDLRGISQLMGPIYMEQRQYKKALAAFERAEREGLLSAGVANNLGVANLQLGNIPNAERYLLQAVQLEPDYAPAQYNLATLYLRVTNLVQAATYLEHYKNLAPENMQALLSYAVVLIQLKNWQEATRILLQIETMENQSPPVLFRLAQALAHTDRKEEALTKLKQAVSLVDARHALSWMLRSEFDPLRTEPGFQRLVRDLGAGN